MQTTNFSDLVLFDLSRNFHSWNRLSVMIPPKANTLWRYIETRWKRDATSDNKVNFRILYLIWKLAYFQTDLVVCNEKKSLLGINWVKSSHFLAWKWYLSSELGPETEKLSNFTPNSHLKHENPSRNNQVIVPGTSVCQRYINLQKFADYQLFRSSSFWSVKKLSFMK